MDSIDLNIENYSIGELEELLSLRTDYTINMIHVQKTELQNKVMGDANISFESREDINKFINNIGITLESALNKTAQKKPPTEFSELKQNMQEVSGHFLIENPNNVDRYSQPATSGIASQSSAPPGIINPIKYKTIKKTINIDSRFRPNYYTTNSSDMQVDLPERIDNITKMSLTSLEIPLSFYTFSHGLGNNVITVRYDILGSDEHVDVPITIPDGNYQVTFVNDTGAKSIEIAINEALRAAIIGSDPKKPHHPALQYLRYSVDTSSCKSVFAMTTEFSNEHNLVGWGFVFNVNSDGSPNPEAPLPLRLGWYLGFRTAAFEMKVNPITKDPGACASEGLCFPKGPNYIYISIDDYCNNSNNYFKAIYNDSINNNNIFARINLASIISDNGVYSVGGDDSFSTSLSRSREYFGPVNIQKMRITIYDEYGRVVILNNMDWSIGLLFECVYS
jgi:hypothetical protein